VSAVQRASRTPLIWSERERPARRQHIESDLQKQVMQFLTVALPPDAVAFAVPNGGLRSPREAARMKGMGVIAGIPDIAIVYRGRSFFIELKAKHGVTSPAQRAMANKLNYCGANVMLCRSGPEVEQQLRECCIPLRATFT
jgi:hypothetical protein